MDPDFPAPDPNPLPLPGTETETGTEGRDSKPSPLDPLSG